LKSHSDRTTDQNLQSHEQSRHISSPSLKLAGLIGLGRSPDVAEVEAEDVGSDGWMTDSSSGASPSEGEHSTATARGRDNSELKRYCMDVFYHARGYCGERAAGGWENAFRKIVSRVDFEDPAKTVFRNQVLAEIKSCNDKLHELDMSLTPAPRWHSDQAIKILKQLLVNVRIIACDVESPSSFPKGEVDSPRRNRSNLALSLAQHGLLTDTGPPNLNEPRPSSRNS
jgi:hypothetical protein